MSRFRSSSRESKRHPAGRYLLGLLGLAGACSGGNSGAELDSFALEFFPAYTEAEPSCIVDALPEFVADVRDVIEGDGDPTLEEWFFEGIFDAEAACL